MKKLRKLIAAFTIALTLTFGMGSVSQVRADGGSGGPQGQTDSRSGGPSAPSGMTQAEYEYFVWIIIMWLLGWILATQRDYKSLVSAALVELWAA